MNTKDMGTTSSTKELKTSTVNIDKIEPTVYDDITSTKINDLKTSAIVEKVNISIVFNDVSTSTKVDDITTITTKNYAKTSNIYSDVSTDNKVIGMSDVVNGTYFVDATTNTADLLENVLLNATTGSENDFNEGSKKLNLIEILANISLSTLQPKVTHKSFTTDKVEITSQTVKSEFCMLLIEIYVF